MTRRHFRRLLRIAAIVIAATAGYWFSVLIQLLCFRRALLPAGILLFVSLFEFVLSDIIATKAFPATTLSKMEVLSHVRSRATLREIASILNDLVCCSPLDQAPVLATAHLTIDLFDPLDEGRGLGLLQLVDYQSSPAVPERERRKGRFRVTSQYQGLIGRTLRTEEEDHVNFISENDYFQGMVHDFGFSKVETATHSKSARSYYARPIKGRDGAVIGVLYMYSTQTNLFPEVILANPALGEAITAVSRQIASVLTAHELGTA